MARAYLCDFDGTVMVEGGNRPDEIVTCEVRPDLVILDLIMPPGPGGLETLARLKERDSTLPVIMMSGKAHLNDAVQAIKRGAFQFLEKPLTPEAVLKLSRPGFKVVAYDTLEDFYLAEALEYVEAWRQATLLQLVVAPGVQFPVSRRVRVADRDALHARQQRAHQVIEPERAMPERCGFHQVHVPRGGYCRSAALIGSRKGRAGHGGSA